MSSVFSPVAKGSILLACVFLAYLLLMLWKEHRQLHLFLNSMGGHDAQVNCAQYQESSRVVSDVGYAVPLPNGQRNEDGEPSEMYVMPNVPFD